MRRANPATPDIRYDEIAHRYSDTRTGRFVSNRAVREAIDEALDNRAKAAAVQADRLIKGEITLAEFQLWGEREIAKVHLANNAAAVGGWAQQSQANYGFVGSQVKPELRKWNDYCKALETGKRPINGTVRNATRGIVQAGRKTYHKTQSREMAKRGWAQERNVLHSSESCAGCLAEDARGWVDVGELIPPGERDPCGAQCRCTVDYQSSDGEVRQ